jgi:uncharacterized protein
MNRLIWFSRYPQPGQSKTRLIPTLGPQGAANLQRRMTEQIATTIRSLHQTDPSLTIDLWYSGGSQTQVETWLPGPWQLLDQDQPDLDQPDPDQPDPKPLDLGQRMARAFRHAFTSGADRTLIIGSDSPSLRPTHLTQAFTALNDSDIILGPALDGGYYLLGMRQLQPLFNADWGSDRVLQQTWTQALDLGLSVQLLEPLRDIDRPEDLESLEWGIGNRE